MPTPEQQAEHFKMVGSLAGMLDKNAATSQFKEAMLESIFPEPKSVKMVSASDVMEKLTVIEDKVDALNRKIDSIFGGCVLMPTGQGIGQSTFIDIKKLSKGYKS